MSIYYRTGSFEDFSFKIAILDSRQQNCLLLCSQQLRQRKLISHKMMEKIPVYLNSMIINLFVRFLSFLLFPKSAHAPIFLTLTLMRNLVTAKIGSFPL